jgi:hypothetical protein
MHDQLAGDGGGDQRAVGGALDLLDGVDGRHADDGCAVLLDGVDGAGYSFGIYQRPDSVVDQHDVVGRGAGQRGEGVGDGVLAGVAAGDDVDLAFVVQVAELVLGQHLGEAVLLGGAHGDVDARHARHGEERPQRVQQERQALEEEELLGSGACGVHAGADAGGGKNHEDRHGRMSITRLTVVSSQLSVFGTGKTVGAEVDSRLTEARCVA